MTVQDISESVQSRLKCVVLKSDLNQKEFADKYHITYEALRSYIYGRRKIPIEFLIDVAKDNNITLDWFYGINDEPRKNDTMVQTLNALSNVFKIKYRKTTFGDDQVLLIDRRFGNFLLDIQQFNYYKEVSVKVDEKYYIEQRRQIFKKHESLLKQIFEDVNFNEDDSIEINNVDGIDLINSAILDNISIV